MQRKLNEQFITGYSERFSDKIASVFFVEKDLVTGKEILSITPSKQVNFFALKIIYTRWQEEMRRLESPYFNYRRPEIKKALVTFMNTLSQHIEVEREHFVPLLKEAVRDTIYWLVDPAAYLRRDFEDRKVSRVSEKMAKTFLKYIRVYKEEMAAIFEESYDEGLEDFFDVADDEFAEMETLAIAESEFGELSRIEPVSLTDILGDSDRVLDSDEEDHLDFEDEPESVMKEEGDDDRAEADIPDSEEMLTERELVTEAYRDMQKDEEEELAEEAGPEDEVEDMPMGEDMPIEDEPEPGADDEGSEYEAEEQFESEEEQDRIDQEMLNEKFAEPAKTVNDQFRQEEEVTLADRHQQKKVDSIMDAISVNHRYMFTRELFNGDQSEFATAIGQVENCGSFDDAVEMLMQDYAKNYTWDMNSEEVKELLKVIFRKFR